MSLKTLTYEIEGIEYLQLQVWVSEGVLYCSRGYRFLDAKGNQVTLPSENGLPRGNEIIEVSMPWEKVPKNIQDALTQLDIYTKSEIEKKEKIKII